MPRPPIAFPPRGLAVALLGLLALLLPSPSAAQSATRPAIADRAVYDGRAGQLDVSLPRLASPDGEPAIDGRLDEPVWAHAAVLTGFSMYQPVDQRPAPDSTEVLVWYSPTALYIGIRAIEPHGGGAAVHATLADRDRLSGDDNVEIHLDTFHDLRRAFVFIVNPLGVQADGTKSEGGGFIPGQNIMPGQNDLSADFLWQSKGRVTEWGYEVEIRIPFRSLRYPARDVQDWGIQIDRHVQHSGYEETWTPARKGSASFIGQEGTLAGLSGMRHGSLVELNPEVTSTVTGAPASGSIQAPGGWDYHNVATLGGNVRWGLGSNFVLNGTVKPDFSQVEADAAQIASDLRFALFYPEKRPFFVEGVEQFNVPNTLVYTRTIAHPTTAAKLTGKLGATDVALLSALDDPRVSVNGGRGPMINIARLRRDFGGQSTVGLLLSDREDGAYFNRLAGGDLRVVFGKLYFAQLQAVASTTTFGSRTPTAPMWEAVIDRTGRNFGFHYNVLGIAPDFVASNGFVPRTGFVQPNVANRFTLFGRQGGLFERYNVFISTNAVWRYHDFFAARSLLEDRASASNEFRFRGGWAVTATPAIGSFAFDPAAYGGYFVGSDQPGSPPAAFHPSDRIGTATLGLGVSTPQFQRFAASLGTTLGHDVDFFETSRVARRDVNASIDWRPTERLRVNGSYVSSLLRRRSDDSIATHSRIPRLKVEYQLARAVFVRFVGQYQAYQQAAFRDPRTGQLLLRQGDVGYGSVGAAASNGLRADWLFSYRPDPGTVFFFGYGSSLTEPDPLAFDRNQLRRVTDGFFLKGSYLLRM